VEALVARQNYGNRTHLHLLPFPLKAPPTSTQTPTPSLTITTTITPPYSETFHSRTRSVVDALKLDRAASQVRNLTLVHLLPSAHHPITHYPVKELVE
jgi:hypothetical protein